MKLLHKIVFWSHLLAGVAGGAVIFIMSATGVVLMYEHQLVEFAERGARQMTPPPTPADRLILSELIAAARQAKPDGRPTGLTLQNDPAASVAVGFGRDGAVFVNPYTGAILGEGSPLHDWFHAVIDWHRWLGTEGEGRATGRAITGACNLAFFWLAITGVYLWWPRSWHWRGVKTVMLFNGRLRGKARDWNWHNVIGFWSSSILVVLTLSGVVMSYPWANDLLYTLTGSEPPPRRGEGPGAQAADARGVRGNARSAAAKLDLDLLLARAEQQVPGWVTIGMRFGGRGDAPIALSIQEPDAWNRFQRSQLTLDRASGEVIRWEPYSANSAGRKLRIWMRGLHTGEALGFMGQTVAGLASLGGCFLVWTGWAMTWRRFRYRKRDPAHVEDGVALEPTAAAAAELEPAADSHQSCLEETVKLKMEQTNSNGPNGQGRNGARAAQQRFSRESPAAADSGNAVLILYATVTGTAESVAQRLEQRLRSAAIQARARDMASCDAEILMQARRALLVVSTYGDGEPPEDAAPFWERVVHGNGLDLRHLEYSVLALGNTTYDQFCKCGRDFDTALERHGARRMHSRQDCDVDYENAADQWLEGVMSVLRSDVQERATA